MVCVFLYGSDLVHAELGTQGAGYRKALSCGACRAQVVVLPAHAVVLALASSTADWDGRSHIACNIGGENRSLAVAHDADAPVFLWSGSSDEGALSLWTTLSQRLLRRALLLSF